MNKNDKKFSLYLESDGVFRQRLLDRIELEHFRTEPFANLIESNSNRSRKFHFIFKISNFD